MTILKRKDLQLFILCCVFFIVFSKVDFAIAQLFFLTDNREWLGHQYLFFKWIYNVLADPKYLVLLLIGLSIYYFVKANNHFKKYIYLFLLCSLLIGPGLLVNVLLKNSSTGRARPSHLVDFNGDKTYTAPFQYSGQCAKNCSFVSGHASLGFFFIGLGWLLANRRYFWIGFIFGCISGFTRIAQGGHFFSDVVFAFWAVYWVNIGLGYLMKIDSPWQARNN